MLFPIGSLQGDVVICGRSVNRVINWRVIAGKVIIDEVTNENRGGIR